MLGRVWNSKSGNRMALENRRCVLITELKNRDTKGYNMFLVITFGNSNVQEVFLQL